MSEREGQIAESVGHHKTAQGEQTEFDFDTHDLLWGFYHAQYDMYQDGYITDIELLANLKEFFIELESRFSE